MPPRKAVLPQDTVYRSGSVTRQRVFPSRTRSVKRYASATPRLVQRQSTLTQLGVSSSSFEVGGDLDDIEVDDGDYDPESREDGNHRSRSPKSRRKKRKTLARTDRDKQSTLTQIVPSLGLKRSFDSEEISPRLELDTMDWLPEPEEHSHRDDGKSARRLRLPAERVRFDLRDAEGDQDDGDQFVPQRDGGPVNSEEDYVGETQLPPPPTHHRKTANLSWHGAPRPNSVSPPQLPERVQEEDASSGSRQQASPELVDSMPRPVTPRFPRDMEIPSSNTPRSVLLFTQETVDLRSPSQSPLKERSGNIPVLQNSPEKVLDTPLRDRFTGQRPDFVKPAVPRKPPKPSLKRVRSTIPDSEEFLEPSLSPLRMSKRSIVQDTQLSAYGPEITGHTQFVPATYNDKYDERSEEDTDDDFPTFDPVCSALNRDAARFMQTQRMLDMQRGMRPLHLEAVEEDLSSRAQLRSELLSSKLEGQAPDLNDAVQGDMASEEDVRRSPPPLLTPIKQESQHPDKPGAVETVDLTLDSFEPPLPLSPGTPTPRRTAQHRTVSQIIDITSSPSSRSSGKIASSPPSMLDDYGLNRINSQRYGGEVDDEDDDDDDDEDDEGDTTLIPLDNDRDKDRSSSQPLPSPHSTSIHNSQQHYIPAPSQISTIAGTQPRHPAPPNNPKATPHHHSDLDGPTLLNNAFDDDQAQDVLAPAPLPSSSSIPRAPFSSPRPLHPAPSSPPAILHRETQHQEQGSTHPDTVLRRLAPQDLDLDPSSRALCLDGGAVGVLDFAGEEVEMGSVDGDDYDEEGHVDVDDDEGKLERERQERDWKCPSEFMSESWMQDSIELPLPPRWGGGR